MADDNSSSARVLPKKKDFSWTGGYQTTGVRGLASIRNRYAGGTSASVIPAGQQFAFGDADQPYQNPNVTTPVAAPNPMFAGDMETQSALGVPPVPGAPPVTQTFPSGRPDGPQNVHPITGGPIGQDDGEKTPEQRAADERRRWLADGGSIATMHRAEAASGLRPRIDARGNPAALNSNAAAEVRAGWGWDPSVTTGSQGAPIAAQMTQNFTAAGSRSGDQNANWNQKFADARKRLQDSLKS